MDLHLDFIVDQTAKYSNWLVKGLATGGSRQTSIEPSLQSAASSSLDGELEYHLSLIISPGVIVSFLSHVFYMKMVNQAFITTRPLRPGLYYDQAFIMTRPLL